MATKELMSLQFPNLDNIYVIPSVYIGDSAPANQNVVVWVDTSGDADGGAIQAPSNPSDGQFLVYSSAQSAWVAQTVPSANGVSF